MIPLLSPEEEDLMNKESVPEVLPILPVRNTVLFPGVVLPITVGRQKSIKLVKKAYKGDRIIGVVAQETSTTEEPAVADLFKVGTVAKILRMLILPDGNTTIIIQGQRRFSIAEVVQEDPFILAKVNVLSENFPDRKKKETKALLQSLKESAGKILKLNPDIPQDAQFALNNIESPGFLTHFLSSNLNTEVKE
ncbi:MAG: LON peptidase substrate-binding domain-containing protein, partial [Cytophagaceae bacterium]